MKDEKDKPNSQPRTGADPTRDEQGRWLPGHCPNPKGRPRRADKVDVDRADISRFMNTEVEIRVGGKLVSMTRQEALLHKMFEGAMKDKVSNQKFFYEVFQQREKDIAELQADYERLIIEWITENPRWQESGVESIPLPVRLQLVRLETLLGRLYPDSYSKDITRMLGLDDDGVNGDSG